jgi:hypothetical protein
MYRWLFAAVLGSTITSAGIGVANAAPISMNAPAAEAAVEKVHGYHRSCRGDPDYLHRHTRSGRRISCGRRHYYRDSGPSFYFRFGDRDRGHRHRHQRHHRRDRH